MLLNLHQVAGRPWAITGEVFDAARRLLEAPDTFGGLRALVALRAQDKYDDAQEGHPPKAAAAGRARGGAGVMVIPVVGLLTQRGDVIDCQETLSTMAVADAVRAAVADQGVHAIVLEADSPGGEVFGIPEAAKVIREARKVKPVVAHAHSRAGSAMYWLASQADELMVTPSGLVGSIGVYSMHEDRSKALEAAGVKRTYVYAGKYKVEGNPVEPLGDEALASIQSDVDRYYGMFVADVAAGRGASVEDVRRGFGEGRMVGAKAAVSQGMANSVGTLDDAIHRAASLATERRRASSSVAQGQAMGLRRGR